MTHKLVLLLAGDHLLLQLARVEPKGLRQMLSGLLRRNAPPQPIGTPISGVDLKGDMTAASLAGLLALALSELQALHSESLAGLALEVQLGLDHAQIGLVDLSSLPCLSMTDVECNGFARAWVAQMLHQNPASCDVRCELLVQQQKLLISCVPLPIVDVLITFAAQSSLRFSSCRPAVLSALERAGSVRVGPALHRDLVWTEASSTGGRSGKVQILRLQGRHLSSIWRGWVPRTGADEHEDSALDDAIGRFRRIHLSGADAAVEHVVWPGAAVPVKLS